MMLAQSGNRSDVGIAGCGAVTAVGIGVDALRIAIRFNASGLAPCHQFSSGAYQSNVVGAVDWKALWAYFNNAYPDLGPDSFGEDDFIPASPEPVAGTAAPAPVVPTGVVLQEQEMRLADDPAWELGVAAINDAHAQARALLPRIAPERNGLVLATTKANIEALERLTDRRPCQPQARQDLQGNLLARNLARTHRVKGPIQCVSAACASGLIAIQQGTKMIQSGAADAVLVVGVDHLSRFVMAGFSALKALAPQGCRPFDRERCGLSAGEAGAAIILVRRSLLHHSTSPSIHPPVVIRGWGGSNDANHLTGPSRDGSGLALAIRRALDCAGLEPGEIEYINAHGTGTVFNDAMESLALRAVFGEHCPPVSASKGMLGHTLGAAGVVETIVCILAMQEGLIPGTPRLQTPAESAPSSLVHEPRRASGLKHVLKLSTGFGGINSALVLEATV